MTLPSSTMAEKPIPYMTPTEILESFTREEMLVEHKLYLFLCEPRYDRIVRDPRNVSATETANRIALDGVTQDNAKENGVIPLNSLIMVFKFSEERTASMQGSFKELTPDDEQKREYRIARRRWNCNVVVRTDVKLRMGGRTRHLFCPAKCQTDTSRWPPIYG